MDLSTDFLSCYLSSTWLIAALFVLLVIYRVACRKNRRLPFVPLGLLIAYLALRLVLNLFSEGFGPELLRWLTVASLIALYCAIFRLAFAFTVEWFFSRTKREAFPKITRDFILIAIYAIIIFVVLRTRGGVNLVGLITTSAVLTAVIGLAAQNTLGNLFAGISLQIEHPFRIGDWIQYGENAGQVVGIGWSMTRLRTFEDEIVYVPNMDLAKSLLKNFSRPSRQHVMKIGVGLDYEAQPNRVRKVLLEALRDEPMVFNDPPPQIRVIDYGDFAVKYELRFVYDDYGTFPVVRAAVMNRLWYALRRNHI
ncbi:MAG: mechanosensitive ion channel family protein, partial [bacterium]